jgi:protein subunit release factor B
MNERKLVLSVTLKDCRVDEFRSGGPGGQNQNKRNTGIRIVHEPSGAVGESREERSQLQNKKAAWKRMAEHPKFKLWLNRQLYENGGDANRGYGWKFEAGRWVRNEAPASEKDIKVEIRRNGQWVEGD